MMHAMTHSLAMPRPRALSRAVFLGLLLAALWAAPLARAQPRWVLVYSRQYGEAMTGGVAGQVELFSYGEAGQRIRVGMTNRFNLGTAIFGTTDPYGNSRVTFDINNRFYDFQVHEPGTPTDVSPDCYWLDGLPHHGHYRFEFHWLRVSEPDAVTTFPQTPAYHYDRVQGFNTSSREASGFSTDAYSLAEWTPYQAQTFVVPAGQNRIIAAKSFCVRRAGERFTMRATIRRGGPTGPQVGPASVSREVFSNEFPNVLMTWALDAVPVEPGEIYALRLDSVDGQGFNVWATNANTYADGELYNGTTRVAGRDMIAVVIGVTVEEPPPLHPIRRGDCNQDEGVDVSDALAVLGYLFLGGSADCLDACDADDTGALDISDGFRVLNYLFRAGPAPPAPFPDCGVDEVEDDLDCERTSCE